MRHLQQTGEVSTDQGLEVRSRGSSPCTAYRLHVDFRKHIFDDLLAYACPFPECSIADAFFQDSEAMMDHLEKCHALDVSLSEVACPLCLKYSSSDRDALSLHLSRHMEEIALAILPSAVDSDIDSDLESINDSKTVSDTKRDNISNTRSPSDSSSIADYGTRSRLSNAENDKDSFAHSANVPAADDNSRNAGSNLLVTGIHPSLTEEEVTLLFERYGQVEGCTIIRDPHSKKSRGFGFVNMVTSTQADAAKEGLQGVVHNGRTLSIENACTARPLNQSPDSPFSEIGISDLDEESSPADMLPGVSDAHVSPWEGSYYSQQQRMPSIQSMIHPWYQDRGKYVFSW